MTALPDTFCILPWMHVFADQRGVLYPCCRGLNSDTPNVDANGRPYRLGEIASLDEAWNSGFMKELRRDLLTGGKPKACASCFLYEEQAMESPREMWNRIHAPLVTDVLATADPDGTAPPIVRTFDIYLGNLCNLRCRMCYPVASKALIKEWPELRGVSEDDPELVEARRLDWFEDDAFWSRFEQFSGHVQNLHFAGGEPLLHERMFDFLERLAASGRSKDITLSYNSNLTVLPERLFELWPRFKGVTLTASIDGVGAVNSLIRNPSDWERLDRNLRFVNENADRMNCTMVNINTTVQVYNIFSLVPLFEYVLELERFMPYPVLTILEHPSWFNVRILPRAMKEEAASRLRDFEERWRGRLPRRRMGHPEKFLSAIDGIIGHMMQRDEPALIPRFVEQSRIFDRRRGEDVCEVIPELAPLFD